MGWSGLTTNRSFEEVFKKEFEYQLQTKQIIKYSIKDIPKRLCDSDNNAESEFWLACMSETNKVYCAVILFHRVKDEVMYKLIVESDGPLTKSNCPKEIMDMLSPLPDLPSYKYARKFRALHS